MNTYWNPLYALSQFWGADDRHGAGWWYLAPALETTLLFGVLGVILAIWAQVTPEGKGPTLAIADRDLTDEPMGWITVFLIAGAFLGIAWPISMFLILVVLAFVTTLGTLTGVLLSLYSLGLKITLRITRRAA